MATWKCDGCGFELVGTENENPACGPCFTGAGVVWEMRRVDPTPQRYVDLRDGSEWEATGRATDKRLEFRHAPGTPRPEWFIASLLWVSGKNRDWFVPILDPNDPRAREPGAVWAAPIGDELWGADSRRQIVPFLEVARGDNCLPPGASSAAGWRCIAFSDTRDAVLAKLQALRDSGEARWAPRWPWRNIAALAERIVSGMDPNAFKAWLPKNDEEAAQRMRALAEVERVMKRAYPPRNQYTTADGCAFVEAAPLLDELSKLRAENERLTIKLDEERRRYAKLCVAYNEHTVPFRAGAAATAPPVRSGGVEVRCESQDPEDAP